jgi:hypothetical protein
MDDLDFLDELDKKVSNINLDIFWDRIIGGHKVRLSPIDFTHQMKVKAVLQNSSNNDEVNNVLDEIKRITISGALTGFDGLDFQNKRQAGKTFRIKGTNGKKDELVDFSELLYRKLAHWDAEFIDLVFEVFTDLMETHRKEMSKDVVFENSKSPREELEELEMKVAELRVRLKLPPLVEAKKLTEDEISGDSEPEDSPEDSIEEELSEEEFDPFKKKVNVESDSVDARLEEPSAVEVPPPFQPTPEQDREPSPIERALQKRVGGPPVSLAVPVVVPPGSRIIAHQAQPSVESDVVEAPAQRKVVDPPVIDPRVDRQNVNPRFKRSGV